MQLFKQLGAVGGGGLVGPHGLIVQGGPRRLIAPTAAQKDFFGIVEDDDLTVINKHSNHYSKSFNNLNSIDDVKEEFKDNNERINHLLSSLKKKMFGSAQKIGEVDTSDLDAFEFRDIKYEEDEVKRLFNGNGLDQKGLMHYLQAGQQPVKGEILKLLSKFFDVRKNSNYELF